MALVSGKYRSCNRRYSRSTTSQVAGVPLRAVKELVMPASSVEVANEQLELR